MMLTKKKFKIISYYIKLILNLFEYFNFKIKYKDDIKVINTAKFNDKNDLKTDRNNEHKKLTVLNNADFEDKVNIFNGFVKDLFLSKFLKLESEDKVKNQLIYEELLTGEKYDVDLYKIIKFSEKGFVYTSYRYYEFFWKYCLKCLGQMIIWGKQIKKNSS